MTDKNLGHATAYGYAKSKGYTGTEEEFAELMASYAEVATDARGYAEQAEQSASNAQTSASNAQASATSAGTSASSASASAQTATTKASEASASATSASESASTAVSAKDDAVTAKESAETAKADAETAAEEAQESAQTVANKADKDGTYPDMTVGGVMSSDGSTDSTPYLYRVSGGGVEVGNIEVDKIVGGTVAFNQLANKYTSGATTNGVTFTPNADGSVSVSGTASTYAIQYVPNPDRVMAIVGHKYFACGCPSGGGVNTWQLSIRVNSGGTIVGNDYGSGAILVFTTSTANDSFSILMRVVTGATINAKFMPQLFDLTQMFGSTIADMIYNMETANAGSGVAFFRKLFPKDYYEYNTGELMSVEGVSAHVMRDADDNIIGSYPLDSSLTLRGIPKLSNGLYFDGDTYEADGTVTRKYGVVDLGTLNWSLQVNTEHTYGSVIPNMMPTTFNLICDKYEARPSGANNKYDTENLVVFTHNDTASPRIRVVNQNVTSGTELKTVLSGVMLVYELATPTTESAEPYESIQKVSKYGTEEYVSTGIVPVGHVTKYPTDIVSKVNGLPSDFSTLIAPTESGFKATRAYSVNQFIIVDNQLYRVTSAIASGATITVGANVAATTIADILTSLLNA